jgi:lysozyme family protein
MGAWVGSCDQEGCHADPEAAWAAKDALIELFGEKYTEAEEVVEEARAAFEMANTTASADMMKLGEAEAKLAELEDVWHEAELSGTLAFHSSWHLEEMLDEVEALADDVIDLSEDAMEPAGKETITVTVSEYGLQILAILGIASALLVATLRRRRVA